MSDARETAPTAPPSFPELARRSPWLAAVPGLVEQVEAWADELPPVRAGLARRARALSRPTVHPAAFGRIGELTGRSAAALGRAIGDLPVALWRRLVFGEDLATPGEQLAARLSDVVRAGGPSLVKLGQFVATAQGLLPDELVAGLAWCRDDVPPMDADTVAGVVADELGAPAAAVFADFDLEPMAAGSIAQAHRATTADGRAVVVKVQRLGLSEALTRDLRALALVAFGLQRTSGTARAVNPAGFVELFAELVLQELDFRLEAGNMVELGLAAEHAGADFVAFPRPLPGLVTERVLVMERLPGVPYTEAAWQAVDPEQRARLLRLVITGVIEHTLVYGVFHGDLHAGNVLATEDGGLSLVDHGIVGRLGDDQRLALVRFMVGFALDDVDAQVAALADFGAVPDTVDRDAMAADLRGAVPPGTALTAEAIGPAIGAVVRVLASHGCRLPAPLLLFFKNLLYLNGFAATVAPDVDLLGEIAPVFAHFQQRYPDQLSQLTGVTAG
jgi:ubiquinone biosynthesis protein